MTAASLSIAIAMWITMAAPVILAQGGPVDVQRWVTGFAAWGLAGSLLVAGDIVAHATLDGSSAAGPTRLLALLGVAAVPIAYGVRRSARCPVRHGWPMIAMHLLGMANPIGAVTLSMSMVLVCGVTRPRLIGSGSLMLVAAVATGG